MEKLLEAMQVQPGVLAYFRLSENVVTKEVEFRDKYEKIKVIIKSLKIS